MLEGGFRIRAVPRSGSLSVMINGPVGIQQRRIEEHHLTCAQSRMFIPISFDDQGQTGRVSRTDFGGHALVLHARIGDHPAVERPPGFDGGDVLPSPAGICVFQPPGDAPRSSATPRG